MRKKGILRSWNDERGFGFIVPNDGGKDVFLHISAFSNRNRRPENGQTVTYAMSTDDRGRPRAKSATLPGDQIPERKRSSGGTWAIPVSIGYLCLVTFSVFVAQIPAVVLLGYLALSALTFFVYAYDKVAAKDGAWRTKESTLHLLSLLGGWPGALIAQQKLRHKTMKQSFRSVLWITVCLNLVAFGWMFAPEGTTSMQSWFDQGESDPGFGQRATIEWAE